MPKQKQVFICTFCGKQFDDWAKCSEHEQGHAQMLSWTDFKPKYNPDDLYPSFIDVPFLDGAVIRYGRTGVVIRQPDKKESPSKTEGLKTKLQL